MRFVDEYRAPEQVMQLIAHLRERASHLSYTAARPLRIMEVCGGHTHAIFKFGLDQLLPENIEFIHGPGCPVCVLPMGRIDTCVEIASHPEVIFCTFGDAIRVPGKKARCYRRKRAVPMCASSIHRWMRWRWRKKSAAQSGVLRPRFRNHHARHGHYAATGESPQHQ